MIMQNIRKMGVYPASKGSFAERIHILQPVNLRSEKDNSGSQYWSPHRPDAKGRNWLVQIDVQLTDGGREANGGSNYHSQIQNYQKKNHSFVKNVCQSVTENEVTDKTSGEAFATARAEIFGLEGSKIKQYIQANKTIGSPRRV